MQQKYMVKADKMRSWAIQCWQMFQAEHLFSAE